MACTNLCRIDVSKNYTNFVSVDGMLCDTKLTRLISYPAKLGWTCRVPEEVRSTGDFAFTGSPLISKVIILETVTSIGDFAFGRCLDLKNVTIPEMSL